MLDGHRGHHLAGASLPASGLGQDSPGADPDIGGTVGQPVEEGCRYLVECLGAVELGAAASHPGDADLLLGVIGPLPRLVRPVAATQHLWFPAGIGGATFVVGAERIAGRRARQHTRSAVQLARGQFEHHHRWPTFASYRNPSGPLKIDSVHTPPTTESTACKPDSLYPFLGKPFHIANDVRVIEQDSTTDQVDPRVGATGSNLR